MGPGYCLRANNRRNDSYRLIGAVEDDPSLEGTRFQAERRTAKVPLRPYRGTASVGTVEASLAKVKLQVYPGGSCD